MIDKIIVSTPTEVVNIHNVVDSHKMERELNNYLKLLSHRINLEDLVHWRLLILVVSRATDGIGVFKKVRRYPLDNEFEMSISIGLPNEEEALYGLAEVKESFFHSLDEKNFYILNSKFEAYDNLHSSILESAKLAIDLAFTKRMTCNGKKVICQNKQQQ